MMSRHLEIGLCLGSLVMGNGCARQEPHSEIVTTVERAGSGELSLTPVPQIEDWLRKDLEFAVRVDDMCKPVRDRADANWPISTEGRVCTAARNAAMFYRQNRNPPTPRDDAFGPGLH
jgi:hypothetical protein